MSFTSCKCERCVSACRRRPGWPTPEEVERAIAAGLAGKFMLDASDYEAKYDGTVPLISPATLGLGGKRAPRTLFMATMFLPAPERLCVFLKNDLCGLHKSGFKPIECREALICDEVDPDKKKASNRRAEMRLLTRWASPAGQAVVAKWKEAVGFSEGKKEG